MEYEQGVRNIIATPHYRDQMFDTPGLRIEIEIPDKSEPFAVADIDDFLSF